MAKIRTPLARTDGAVLQAALPAALRAAWAAPLAWAFGAAVALRRWAYDSGLRRRHVPPLRLLSVGGLEAGGSGKTPVTGLLLDELRRLGVSCGLLTRGYGRPGRALGVRRVGGPVDFAAVGDEAAMLVAAGRDVPVAACPDRRRGAAALSALGCTAAVMDDGFAHRRLRRELDLVVLRAEQPFGDGRYLPWGGLRESPRGLRRAAAAIVYGGVGALDGWPDDATRARLHRLLASALGRGRHVADVDHEATSAAPLAAATEWAAPGAAGDAPVALSLGWARARLRPVHPDVADARGGRLALGAPVVAAAGIARPTKFFAALGAAGVSVVATRAFPDHHRFHLADVQALIAWARRHQATAVAVTAKDAVKLAPLWPAGAPPLQPWTLDVAARLPAAVAAWLRATAAP